MNSLNYMEKLLDGVDVEWKSLGEVCSVGVGQAHKNNEIGEYSFVNAGTTPSGYLSDYNTDSDTITTPSRGQGGIGYVGYQSRKFWCGPLCYRIRSTSETVLTRFLYHIMSNRTMEIIGLANMTGVPALNRKELVGFPIPIPCPENPEKSLEIQAEIVRILDTFTELTTELTARKKQYTYYRDQLLTFEEGHVEWKTLGDVTEKWY
jgi:type I restriction enzyme S subunit